jgi:hypothetical protein
MRSADKTKRPAPELTGRERLSQAFESSDERRAQPASVE